MRSSNSTYANYRAFLSLLALLILNGCISSGNGRRISANSATIESFDKIGVFFWNPSLDFSTPYKPPVASILDQLMTSPSASDPAEISEIQKLKDSKISELTEQGFIRELSKIVDTELNILDENAYVVVERKSGGRKVDVVNSAKQQNFDAVLEIQLDPLAHAFYTKTG